MDIADIRQQLSDLGLSRAEFASGIGVSVSSVNAWLSGFREITAKRMDVIEYFLSHYSADAEKNAPATPTPEPEPEAAPRTRYLVAPLTEEEYAITLRAAAILGMPENDFARWALLSESENVIEGKKTTGQRIV